MANPNANTILAQECSRVGGILRPVKHVLTGTKSDYSESLSYTTHKYVSLSVHHKLLFLKLWREISVNDKT